MVPFKLADEVPALNSYSCKGNSLSYLASFLKDAVPGTRLTVSQNIGLHC